jgi:uncharacterized membrane protein YGL010W
MNAHTTVDDWADEFGRLRSSGPQAVAAWLGIPLVIASLLGLLWIAPAPTVLTDASPAINLATLFIMAAFVYYCILSIRLALGGLVFLLAAATPSALLEHASVPTGLLAGAVFAASFAWQLLETRRATGRFEILRNLQYVMLGPIWLLRAVFRRAGVEY